MKTKPSALPLQALPALPWLEALAMAHAGQRPALRSQHATRAMAWATPAEPTLEPWSEEVMASEPQAQRSPARQAKSLGSSIAAAPQLQRAAPAPLALASAKAQQRTPVASPPKVSRPVTESLLRPAIASFDAECIARSSDTESVQLARPPSWPSQVRPDVQARPQQEPASALAPMPTAPLRALQAKPNRAQRPLGATPQPLKLQLTIGRIDIHLTPPRPQAAPAPSAPAASRSRNGGGTLSLADYLRQRKLSSGGSAGGGV